ncbi:MAG: biotin--[acetyl-CoA-carboxylase] ligase [Chloroflexi bacterium]|nr:biotin--[acetyl-CoA-carboxylase] ligase [Chloroflexota bacterium]MCY3697970.1 biotin--[acetyl-CoA-carboxylase] ligase [Chloroflexota bacterium]
MADPDLLPPDQRLDLDRVRTLLTTAEFGQHFHYFVQTTSTMDDARRLAEDGAPHGTVVVADEQTAGRGTKGRIWVSPPGQSIHATIIVRPDIEQLKRLSIVSPVATTDAVCATTPLEPTIKWPNDVQIDQRKLGGILIEAEWRDRQPGYALVGIGLNVNFDPAPWATQIDRPATSLMIELGARLEREPVLAALLNAFESRYRQAGTRELHEIWIARLNTLNREVTVTLTTGERIEGKAVAVDGSGALTVQTTDGDLRTFIAGEVTLRESGSPTS